MTAPPAETIRLPPLASLAQKPWDGAVAAAHPPGQTIATARSDDTRRQGDIPRGGITLGPELGRGGFGLINLATQEVFGRRVAVKRLIGTREGDARKFYAEAIITAQLQHPNVVPIHDLTRDGDGRLQLVMKVIEGVSWRDLLAPRTPEHERLAKGRTRDDHLDILLRVCDAVGFAHDRGILHRDLKPENVMVGAFGEVQLMDWGCAVAFGSQASHPAVPRVENLDQIAGTPSFMAPEMALMREEAIGPHTDVYLLGGILYQILTGTPPHDKPTVHEALMQAAESRVEPPQERAPDRDIPDELAWISISAMARDPAERTPTVAVFARQLKEYRDHAQAMRLAAVAKQFIAEAEAHSDDADELLRRAMAAADNAVELWPQRTAGLRVQLQATLAYAGQALTRADLAGAAAVAERARGMATALKDRAQADAAAGIAERSMRAIDAQRARDRHVRHLRLGLGVGAVVALLGLVVGIAVLSAQQARTSHALTETQATLRRLDAERERRHADQRSAAPGLVAQARQLVAEKRLDEAERIAALAVDFDGELGGAHAVLACLRAARGAYAEARAEAGEWARTASSDADAPALAALCERAGKVSGELPPDLTLAFGDLFGHQGLTALAESRMLTPERRLAFYRSRINAAWPGAGAALELHPNGVLYLLENGRQGLAWNQSVVDLRPLAGMPFESLSLARTGVFDLAPLAGAPLVHLDVSYTKTRDLAPLARCPSLESVFISYTEVSDLRPIATPHLKVLQAGGDTALADLSPLAGSGLEELGLTHASVRDLSPLRGCPVRALDTAYCQIDDWRALQALPLHLLTVDYSNFDDQALTALSPATLERLRIGGTHVTDLRPLRAMTRLSVLSVALLPVTDITPISGLPLRVLSLAGTKVTDLGLLHAMRQLEDLDLGDVPAKEFWALSGLRLSRLRISGTSLSDLSAFDVSQLTDLAFDRTTVTDLTPLRRAQLSRLDCHGTPVSDLRPLVQQPLTELIIASTRVSDLSPLKGIATLRSLEIDRTPVASLAPLAALPLERLRIGPADRLRSYKGMSELRAMSSLRTIEVWSTAKGSALIVPVSDFWKRIDANDYASFN
jgi:hypothetical protein